VDLLLGIDMGTGSTKGLLVDPSGSVIASESVSHAMQLPRPVGRKSMPRRCGGARYVTSAGR
jgi:sugar (pentulose or hexulose) kinase